MYLARLKIVNFAVIKEINVDFKKGFNVLTGETGAGKSIIVDALSLSLGEKLPTDVIRSGEEYTSVEVTFNELDSNKNVREFMIENEIPFINSNIILKRELYRSGRTKSFINNKQVNLSLLKRVGDIIVDLHGQHDHQALLKDATHIDYLDLFANTKSDIIKLKEIYNRINNIKEKISILEEKKKIFNEKKELWEFQINEIDRIDPKPGEYDELMEEKRVLENSEKIFQISKEINSAIYESENSIFEQLQAVEKKLSQLCDISSGFKEYHEQIFNLKFILRELSERIADFVSSIDFNPSRLDYINNRIFTLQQLMKKYNKTINEIIEYRKELDCKMIEDEDLDKKILILREDLEKLQDQYLKLALEISRKRKESALQFQREVENKLNFLGIKKAKFVINIKYIEDKDGPFIVDGVPVSATSSGIDEVKFKISTNPGEDVKPFSLIVSGGEVSRIMLAIKSILAGKDNIPVLIFDEIDTGISGKIAHVVGEELLKLGKYHQIICITHLPQIACLGTYHYKVYKEIKDGKTYTLIKSLNEDERIMEIASLVSGKNITDTSIIQAKEMLGQNRKN
ncbi:MAG: DNA repair protein RecN [Candidatus Marinimicrobia bacterium]|nr:DNA repair protein RecN [Candidatus Neomarinimicrobiota bacterium]